MRNAMDGARLTYTVLGWYQVLCVTWSTAALVSLLRNGNALLSPFGILVLMTLAVFGLGGVLLVKGRQSGVILSFAAQALQLVQLIVGGMAFRCLAGLELTVFYLGKGRFDWVGGMTASLTFWRGVNDPPFAIGVNLIALVAIVLLGAARRGESTHQRGADRV